MIDASGSIGNSSGVENLEFTSLSEALTHVALLQDLGHGQQARDLLVSVRAAWPDCPRTAYLLGCALLSAGDESGLEHLKYAMAKDETATGAVCARAVLFLSAQGNTESLIGYQKKLDTWHLSSSVTLATSEDVLPGDQLRPLPSSQREELEVALKALEGTLICGFAVRKVMPEWHDVAPTWLVLKPAQPSAATCAALVNSVAENALASITFDAPRLRLLVPSETSLLEHLRSIPDACLWDNDDGGIAHKVHVAGH